MLLAAKALKSAKSYDANCGGPSAFEVINKDGNYRQVAYDFYHTEVFVEQYEYQAGSLLFFVAPQNKDNFMFDEKLREFTETMKSIREAWTKIEEGRQNLIKLGFLP